MDFRVFITDPSVAAAKMIENPGESWRRGFGIATPEEEIAAVIHYARKGFPSGGKSLTIQPPHKTTALRRELMAIAEDAAREGRMEIDKDVLGYTYMGHPSHVKESMRLTNRRKPELLADEEQHRAIGKLLGYDQDAIEEFVGRMKSKDRLRDDLE
jgi:hypothetical protein